VQVAKVITPAPPPPAPASTPETAPQTQAQTQAQPLQQQQQAPAATPPPAPVTNNNPAPATATPAVASTESPKIVPAQLIRRTSMTYPPAARSARIEGAVELVAIVKANGQVKDVKVLKGNPYLAPHAANSVRLWLYEPATMNGKPIESEVSITLNFKRPD
jgi:periplasmic protein TonB